MNQQQINPILTNSLNALAEFIGQWAIDKGWMDPDQPRDIYKLCMLVNTELAELCEAYRRGTEDDPCDKTPDLSQKDEEFADALIRILQMAIEHKVDIGRAVALKMEYNQTRPFKHGKKD